MGASQIWWSKMGFPSHDGTFKKIQKVRQWFECECDTIKYINLQFWNTISTILQNQCANANKYLEKKPSLAACFSHLVSKESPRSSILKHHIPPFRRGFNTEDVGFFWRFNWWLVSLHPDWEKPFSPIMVQWKFWITKWKETIILKIPSLKLTAGNWKWMVGRRILSFWGS